MDVKQGYVRHQHKPFQRKSQQSPPVVEAGGSKKMIVGVVILLSVGLIGGYWVVQHFVNKAKTTPLPVSNVKASIKQEEATKAVTGLVVKAENLNVTTKPIHYTFYKGLKKTELLVDAEPIPIVLSVPYYILAGTFGSLKDAKQEQARLKKLGQLVELKVIKLKQTYYRLSIGPFFNRLKMNKKRNELHKVGVDTLIVKTRLKSTKAH